MPSKSIQIRRMLVRLWSAIPDPRVWAWLLWGLGLTLGAAAFWATLDLSMPVAIGLWSVAVAAGLSLALRAEPLLWTPDGQPEVEGDVTPAPDEPPPRPSRPTLLNMVPIPAGEFLMGSPPATAAEIDEYVPEWAEAMGKKPEELKEVEEQVKNWRKVEEPTHRVRVSPFLIARVPLTRGQWRAVMPDTPSEWESDGSDDALPATHLDWAQALACCNALSEHQGFAPCYRKDAEDVWHREPTADGYRLPTEVEWETACRAGTETRWFWGDESKGADEHAWYRGNSEGRLHPVGKKAPNPRKLHDMAGLVYEWCWDRYGGYPQDAGELQVDPQGPDDGDSRVVRGGSFLSPPVGLRSAYRAFIRPDFRLVALGLRCVRSRARQH